MASTSLTFTLEGRDRLSRVLDKAGDSAKGLEKKLALVGAAIPAAAALAPLAAQAGAAAVAVAAFGAAIVPQIGALSDASQAQKKYEDAVAKSGATSEAAITAQLAFQQQIAKMPPASREAAAGLSTLKKQYQGWSDSLAEDTMPVFTKGLGVASAMLPKLTPLVKGASTELDRFMTTVAAGVNTSAFDRLSGKFSEFATGSLKRANDGLIHLMRTLDTGKVGGALSEFMDYARAQGPLLAETLKNVGTAALNLLQAASGVGVGLLQLANSAAAVVAALPPGFVTVLMQTAIAIRAVRLAGSGIQLLAGGFSMASTAIRSMGTAALGSATRMGSLRLALGTLSTGAKLNLAAVGIGLAVVAITKLAKLGKAAPPDVDKLSASLVKLTQTGKSTGEASRVFGEDLSGLYDSVRNITDPSLVDQIQNGFVKIFTAGQVNSTASSDAQERLDAIDDSLVKFVQGGNAQMAAAALDLLAAKYAKGGHDAAKFRGQMDEYNKALEDQKFAQELAAQAQGLFGAQAQKTQTALAAQKKSADGLRQSIQALNDVQRAGLGGMIGFEASIDAAAKAAKENAGSLHMVNGALDLNSPKAQAAASALSDLAAKTDEAAAASRESTGSWSGAVAIYERGRAKLVETAMAMGLTKKQAEQLAGQILKTPDKTAMLKGDLEDLKKKLTEAKDRLKKAPDSKTAKFKGDIRDLQRKIADAQAQILGIKGRTVTVQVRAAGIGAAAAAIAGLGGVPALGGYAGGGRPKRGEVAWVGENGPELMSFNGSERIFDHATSKAMISPSADAGRFAGQGLALGLGGAASGVGAAARAMAAAVTAGIKEELQIASPSKKTKALAKDVGKGFIDGLTGSRDKIKSVAKDLANDIKTAFSGKKESNLLKYIDKQTKKLLDAAAKRDKIAAKIAEAKKYASDVTSAARETAGLSNLGMEPEQVTAGGIKAGLAVKLAQIRQFTKYIDILAKKGLNKSLLRQILNMGPEAGYAYASALVGADKSTFKAINSTQAQLDKATTKLGKNGADALYDSGKNAGKGFLTGLKSQQKDIENLMMKIAKGMQKAIKKALGIKSPSTVMAEVGRFSTIGLARGLVDALPAVDQALGVVTGRVAGARPVMGRAAASGPGGGTTIILNVDVKPGANAHEVWQEIRQGLLSLKRGNGGGSLGLA